MTKKNIPIFLHFMEKADKSPIERFYNVRCDGRYGYQLIQLYYKPISFF